MSEWILEEADYRYEHSEIKTLDRIEGSFQTGRSYQIFGDPGSGKTTLLALFAGLAVCTKGSLTYDGQEIVSLERHRYRGGEVACLFQTGSLLKDSPMANLEMEVLLSGEKPEKERLKSLLLSVGLAENQLRLPTNRLSESDRQLVTLAKLMTKSKAKLVLVDEPEKVFSECGVLFAMTRLRNYCLQQKKCLIFTTQSPQSVNFADELWGLNGGKLLFIKEQRPS